MTHTERELLGAVADRDEAAFEQLCALYQAPLRRHIARIVRSPDAAEDLLQDTLLRIWTHASQWDDRGRPRAWLFRIATTVALNALRSERRRPQAPLTPPAGPDADEWLVDPSDGPEALAERAEERARLRSLVAGLSEEKREVLRLIHGDDRSFEEVARTLGIPAGTVRSRLHYATRRLLQAWWETADD
jgi:RNA polymerase sigma-70 factor (ECF subfamily)